MNLDTFTQAYIECALWSSTDNQGVPLDRNYSARHLEEPTLSIMVFDCFKFQQQNDLTGYPLQNAGHDFWLTRNHHGSGFWENDYGTEAQCAKLTEAAHAAGELTLYVTDEGKIAI